jgi:hypothetical protein
MDEYKVLSVSDEAVASSWLSLRLGKKLILQKCDRLVSSFSMKNVRQDFIKSLSST